jgi:hypothetical protein
MITTKLTDQQRRAASPAAIVAIIFGAALILAFVGRLGAEGTHVSVVATPSS